MLHMPRQSRVKSASRYPSYEIAKTWVPPTELNTRFHEQILNGGYCL